jgi:hypothetical protein
METTLKIKRVQNGYVVERDGKTSVHEKPEGVISAVGSLIIADLSGMESGDHYKINITADRDIIPLEKGAPAASETLQE